jgi:hypothetical protein
MNEESKLTLRICLSIIGAAAAMVAVIYGLWLFMESIQ